MDTRHQVLTPILNPLHGTLELHGQRGTDDLLRIHMRLRAKATAHIGSDDADPHFRDPQQIGQPRSQEMRNLRRGPDRHGSSTHIVLGDTPSALEWNAGDPRAPEGLTQDSIRRGERLLDIPRLELALKDHVAADLVVNQRSARFQRPLDVADSRERLVIDRHEVDTILRYIATFSYHDGHCFPYESYFACRQPGALGWLVARQPDLHPHRLAQLDQVVAREYPDHPRNRCGSRGLNGSDPRMSMRAPDKGKMDELRHTKVVNELPPPFQELVILHTKQPLTDMTRACGFRRSRLYLMC